MNGNHPYEDVGKNGDHPYEDLAKSNYKPKCELQIYIINFLYSWLYTEKTNIEIMVIWEGDVGRGKGNFFLVNLCVPIKFQICSHQVTKMFPSSFQNVHQVPNVFPNTFPIITPPFLFIPCFSLKVQL
jgi:hypothetical protein